MHFPLLQQIFCLQEMQPPQSSCFLNSFLNVHSYHNISLLHIYLVLFPFTQLIHCGTGFSTLAQKISYHFATQQCQIKTALPSSIIFGFLTRHSMDMLLHRGFSTLGQNITNHNNNKLLVFCLLPYSQYSFSNNSTYILCC
jgi:hypothetical protein